MPNHKSVEYTYVTAPDATVPAPETFLAPSDIHGRVRLCYGKLEGGEQTLAEDDTVQFFELPAGARPLGFIINTGAMGSSVTLSLGDGTTADRFVTAYSVAAATNSVKASEDMSVLTADTVLTATLAGANPADDKDIEVVALYATD
ncbi:hypothetical protein [uncultured Rhodospira sp.]|uniref:hypothetical protein n=1 Tax=uncultured Rhodospira sp. TaxID=1936189 RepID=UPI0026344A2B|nr:hypothetical protein [uncultured Rhodospira sp.]